MKNQLIGLFLFFTLALSGQSQLPDVYRGFVEPAFVIVMNNDVIKPDQEWFAYCGIEGKNTLIGKGVWTLNTTMIADTGCVISAGLNDGGITSPEQRTGAIYGQVIQLGIVKNGIMYELIPTIIKDSQYNVVKEIRAYPISLYTIEGVTIGQEIVDINEVPYFTWLHRQVPIQGQIQKTVNVVFPTGKTWVKISYPEFKPNYLYNTKYELVNSTSSIDKYNWMITLYKADANKGFLDMKITGNDYVGNKYIFNHKIIIKYAGTPLPTPVTFIKPVPGSFGDKYLSITQNGRYFTFRNNTNKSLIISIRAFANMTLSNNSPYKKTMWSTTTYEKVKGTKVVVEYQVLPIKDFPTHKGNLTIIIK